MHVVGHCCRVLVPSEMLRMQQKVMEIGKNTKLGVLRCVSLQLWRIIQEDFGARWIDACLLSWVTQYCRALSDPLQDDKFERCL